MEAFPFHYDKLLGSWVSKPSLVDVALKKSHVSVLTYNVFFGPYQDQLRYPALLEELKSRSPDFICLQEITSRFLRFLQADEWIRAHYDMALTEIENNYFELILSQFLVEKYYWYPLPSHMGRKLLVAKFQLNNETINLATVHLESLEPNSYQRAQQLKIIFPLITSTADTSLLMGDFNLCSTSEENKNLSPDFLDIWPCLHPDDNGWTENTDINVMRYKINPQDKHVRYDRILLKSQKWKPLSIELVGTKPVSPDHKDIFPSDHFGLLATIDCT